jgi:hypothetical protein
MREFFFSKMLVTGVAALLVGSAVGYAEDMVESGLFSKLELVYADDFDGELNSDYWEVRQNSTWEDRGVE